MCSHFVVWQGYYIFSMGFFAGSNVIYINPIHYYATTITFGVLLVVNEELIDVSWNGTIFGGYDLIYLTSSLSSTTGSNSSFTTVNKQ